MLEKGCSISYYSGPTNHWSTIVVCKTKVIRTSLFLDVRKRSPITSEKEKGRVVGTETICQSSEHTELRPVCGIVTSNASTLSPTKEEDLLYLHSRQRELAVHSACWRLTQSMLYVWRACFLTSESKNSEANKCYKVILRHSFVPFSGSQEMPPLCLPVWGTCLRTWMGTSPKDNHIQIIKLLSQSFATPMFSTCM